MSHGVASRHHAVAITGASGFIGGALVRALAARGSPVIGLCRDPASQPSLHHVEWRPYSVAAPLDRAVLTGSGVVVHCAYAPHVAGGPDVVALNVEAAAALHAASRACGLERFVFISSLSAIQGGASQYGRQKRAIEQLCDPGRDLVIRPGLVLGDGGFARALTSLVTARRVVPLVGGGRQPVYVLGSDELCDGVSAGLARGLVGRYTIAAPAAVTLRALVERIAAAVGARPWLLPVPEWPVRLAAWAADRLGWPLPISTEQLEGLRHLARHDFATDLDTLGIVPRPVEETLERLWPSGKTC